jgi:histone H3/H4
MASLIVESKLKELVKSIDPKMRVSADFAEELAKHLEQKIKHYVKRARHNGRQTLQPYDL